MEITSENYFMKTDILNFIENLSQVGIAASDQKNEQNPLAITCSYKNNVDGSIRWIWPTFSHETDYFKFYHIASFKTKLFTQLTKWVIKLGLGNLFADGSFVIYVNKESSNKLFNRWAYFLGTIGPNRKAIFWHKDIDTNQAYFTKIALTKKSQENIENEFIHITKFQKQNFRHIQFPNATWIKDKFIELNDISKDTYRTNRLNELPVEAIHEWLQQDIKKEVYYHSAFKNTIDEIQNTSSKNIHPKISSHLFNKLKDLSATFITTKSIKVATSHGDFTPWNVLCKNNSLALIDFENSQEGKPALFDLFHFVYQSNILIGNRSYDSIRKELDAIIALPEWQHFLVANDLDFHELESMYLIENIFEHIQLYTAQPKWHMQVNWLLNTWSEALTYQLNTRKIKTNKQLFLTDLKDFLKNKSYAYMKHQQKDWLNLPENSDIDLCVNEATLKDMISFLDKNNLIDTYHVKHFSYLKQIEIHFTNREVLYIDLILAFKRKNINYLNAEDVLATSKLNIHQIKVAEPIYEFLYTYLFYTLNHSKIPSKYISQLINIFLSAKVENQTFILDYLGFDSLELFLALENQHHPFSKIAKHIKHRKSNQGISNIINTIIYILDSIGSFFQSSGYIVTFSGVDGAGKSTIIENIKFILEKKYRKPIVVLRHRPSILPIISAWKYGKNNAEKMSVENLPRTGNNTSKLSSFLRFMYYYSDYFVGQAYIYFKYTLRGYIVIYDRYYFDFINDAKRSNIVLPENIISALYFFISKPKYNFFLYAPVEVILNRKQELEPYTITELTNKYLHLFTNLQLKYKNSSYDSIMNIDMNETISTIEHKLINA